MKKVNQITLLFYLFLFLAWLSFIFLFVFLSFKTFIWWAFLLTFLAFFIFLCFCLFLYKKKQKEEIISLKTKLKIKEGYALLWENKWVIITITDEKMNYCFEKDKNFIQNTIPMATIKSIENVKKGHRLFLKIEQQSNRILLFEWPLFFKKQAEELMEFFKQKMVSN